MCGIYGLLWRDEGAINKMIDLSSSRGPDARGVYVDDDISLGHNLLAIMDVPDNSRQPWFIENFVLCYNGEIYNYHKLRDDLSNNGHCFKTDCDTEVLARGLFDQGVEFLKKIDGMYALAWYDVRKKTLVLARDSIGSRPLYYSTVNNKLCFSSTMKSLLSLIHNRNVDVLALKLQVTLGHVPGPKTNFKNISKLVPGEILTFDVKTNATIDKRVFYQKILQKNSYDPTTFRAFMSQSVNETLISKRPIGLFLSGGLDSSIILHEASKKYDRIKTFTVRFDTEDENFNEDAALAKKLSVRYGTDHQEIFIDEATYTDTLEKSIKAIANGPLGAQNISPRYILNEAANRAGCVVVLTGDGGDELFFGYKRHQKLLHLAGGTPLQKWLEVRKRILKEAIKIDIKDEELLDYVNSYIPSSNLPENELDCHLFYEWNTHLPEEYLIREDLIGSFFSIESRYPLLTDPFRKYAQSINANEKLSPGIPSKYMMREAYRHILPDYIIDKRKTAFISPFVRWASKENSVFKNFIDGALDEKYNPETNDLFDLDYFKNTEYCVKTRNIRAALNIANYRIWAEEYGVSLQ